MLRELADAVCARRLGTVAVFFLESVKPLSFIGSQAMLALGPLAAVLVDPKRYNAFAEALEDRATLERLIRMIEDKERSPSAGN